MHKIEAETFPPDDRRHAPARAALLTRRDAAQGCRATWSSSMATRCRPRIWTSANSIARLKRYNTSALTSPPRQKLFRRRNAMSFTQKFGFSARSRWPMGSSMAGTRRRSKPRGPQRNRSAYERFDNSYGQQPTRSDGSRHLWLAAVANEPAFDGRNELFETTKNTITLSAGEVGGQFYLVFQGLIEDAFVDGAFNRKSAFASMPRRTVLIIPSSPSRRSASKARKTRAT